MPEHALDVEYLFTLRALTGGAHVVGSGPKGHRIVVGVTGGDFEGPRLRGTVVTPGGDWVTTQSGGVVRLDVRLLMKTDDGAGILATYSGVGHTGPDGVIDVRMAPTFETGDERYAWLNEVQAVGLGRTVDGGVVYEVYRLL